MFRFRFNHPIIRFIVGLLFYFLLVFPFQHSPTKDLKLNEIQLIDGRNFLPLINRSTLPKRSVVNYFREYRTLIHGSLNNEILYAIWIIVQFQYRWLKAVGSIGEIGFHHGQLTTFLFMMRRFSEQRLFAIDSSEREKRKFLSHVQRYADVFENDIQMYLNSSINVNRTFSPNSSYVKWWNRSVVAGRAIQLISINGSRTEASTYLNLCLISKSLIDGGVVIVDETIDLSVRYGILRFLSETSTFIRDKKLIKQLTERPTESNIPLSKRIIRATQSPPNDQCLRLVPFLYFHKKLFLTTPNFYPQYINLIGSGENFANAARDDGIFYLEYHALDFTFGSIPVWMDNHRLTTVEKERIFSDRIENIWRRNLLTSKHFVFTD